MQLDETPAVVTAGVGLFAEALAAQAADVTPVQWQPPAPGTAEALAAVMADPRVADANAEAVRRLTTARPRLVGIERAGDALGLERGEFLHAGPPIDWSDLSGPVRGALLGAMVYEGMADSVQAAESIAPTVRLAPCHSRHAVGPMAGLISPSMPVFVMHDDVFDVTAYWTTPTSTLANPRLINNDPNAKVPLTFLVADLPEAQKCDWAQVYLPVRPNGSTGWVKSTDVAFAVNDYRIDVTLSAFSLRVFKDGDQVEDIKIGVARDNTPTPGGLYFTTELIKTPNPGGAYGPYAFGLSGFSDTLTTFNGGPGQLGIHGTNEPSAIGTQVSHGCIRMANDDIIRLARFLPLGTPVQIDA